MQRLNYFKATALFFFKTLYYLTETVLKSHAVKICVQKRLSILYNVQKPCSSPINSALSN